MISHLQRPWNDPLSFVLRQRSAEFDHFFRQLACITQLADSNGWASSLEKGEQLLFRTG
jgi:hypothetical protein